VGLQLTLYVCNTVPPNVGQLHVRHKPFVTNATASMIKIDSSTPFITNLSLFICRSREFRWHF